MRPRIVGLDEEGRVTDLWLNSTDLANIGGGAQGPAGDSPNSEPAYYALAFIQKT